MTSDWKKTEGFPGESVWGRVPHSWSLGHQQDDGPSTAADLQHELCMSCAMLQTWINCKEDWSKTPPQWLTEVTQKPSLHSVDSQTCRSRSLAARTLMVQNNKATLRRLICSRQDVQVCQHWSLTFVLLFYPNDQSGCLWTRSISVRRTDVCSTETPAMTGPAASVFDFCCWLSVITLLIQAELAVKIQPVNLISPTESMPFLFVGLLFALHSQDRFYLSLKLFSSKF